MSPFHAAGWSWAAWGLYWAWAALGAARPERREPVASRLTHILPLMAAFLLLFAGWRTGPLETPLFPRAAAWPGAALTVLGLAFAVWARVHLGRNWSGEVQLKEGHRLIRTGPYALVRNPIYTGMLAAAIGTAAAQGRARGALAVLFMLAAFVRKISIEEGVLAPNFGAEYDAYRREVRALIPFVY